jgi:hypothetical protein
VTRLFGLGQYRNDWAQAEPLAQSIADNISPKLSQVGFVVPMPASSQRARQPASNRGSQQAGGHFKHSCPWQCADKGHEWEVPQGFEYEGAACANCPRVASTMSVCAAKLIKFWSLIAGFFAGFF